MGRRSCGARVMSVFFFFLPDTRVIREYGYGGAARDDDDDDGPGRLTAVGDAILFPVATVGGHDHFARMLRLDRSVSVGLPNRDV